MNDRNQPHMDIRFKEFIDQLDVSEKTMEDHINDVKKFITETVIGKLKSFPPTVWVHTREDHGDQVGDLKGFIFILDGKSDWNDLESRDRAIQDIGRKCHHENVYPILFTFACEAFMSKPVDAASLVMPSEDPSRMDVVFITSHSIISKEFFSAFAEVEYDSNEIIQFKNQAAPWEIMSHRQKGATAESAQLRQFMVGYSKAHLERNGEGMPEDLKTKLKSVIEKNERK